MGPRLLGMAVLLIILVSGPASADIILEEDSWTLFDPIEEGTLQDEELEDMMIHTSDDKLLVTVEDNKFNISSHLNFNGEAYITIYNDTCPIVLNVTVLPVNDLPEITNISLNGDPASMTNPVVYGVSFVDVDSDLITVTWYLDGEEIGTGIEGQRYIYPDQNNLTVVIDDGNGGTDSMTVIIQTIPPEGWDDDPDNTRNRVIFWIIFGSAGMILLAVMVWVLFKPERIEKKEPSSVKGK